MREEARNFILNTKTLRKFIKETGIELFTALEIVKKADWNYEKALEVSNL